jgi:hypothetical protein
MEKKKLEERSTEGRAPRSCTTVGAALIFDLCGKGRCEREPVVDRIEEPK